MSIVTGTSDGEEVGLIQSSVVAGLIAYNEAFLGPGRRQPLASAARDPEGRIVGGVTGAIFNDLLLIEYVWIDVSLLGQGLGSRLLRDIEEGARQKGAWRAIVDTFTFQAAPFYERNGYVEVARIPNYLGEYDRIYLTKRSL